MFFFLLLFRALHIPFFLCQLLFHGNKGSFQCYLFFFVSVELSLYLYLYIHVTYFQSFCKEVYRWIDFFFFFKFFLVYYVTSFMLYWWTLSLRYLSRLVNQSSYDDENPPFEGTCSWWNPNWRENLPSWQRNASTLVKHVSFSPFSIHWLTLDTSDAIRSLHLVTNSPEKKFTHRILAAQPWNGVNGHKNPGLESKFYTGRINATVNTLPIPITSKAFFTTGSLNHHQAAEVYADRSPVYALTFPDDQSS